MDILIINEKYSSNIGDQALFRGVNVYFKNNNIDSFDFSGRKKIIASSGRKNVKSKIPGFFIRPLNIARSLLMIIKNLRILSKKIRGNDLIIFGGGSLLIDNNLNFPSKLFFYSLLIKFYGKDYIILACSARAVSNGLAHFMLSKFINGAYRIGLRDNKSINFVEEKFNSRKCYLTLDPALFLKNVSNNLKKHDRKHIAINVMAPQRHGYFSEKLKHNAYLSMIQNLIDSLTDYKITIFSTGDSLDNYFIKNHYKDHKNINVFIPNSINSLLSFLSSKEKIFSTRLHASILALSQDVLPYSFSWDTKVSGYLDTVNMSNYFLDLQNSENKIQDLIRYAKTPQTDHENKLISSMKENIHMDYNNFCLDLC